jgi:hypothetical protein
LRRDDIKITIDFDKWIKIWKTIKILLLFKIWKIYIKNILKN